METQKAFLLEYLQSFNLLIVVSYVCCHYTKFFPLLPLTLMFCVEQGCLACLHMFQSMWRGLATNYELMMILFSNPVLFISTDLNYNAWNCNFPAYLACTPSQVWLPLEMRWPISLLVASQSSPFGHQFCCGPDESGTAWHNWQYLHENLLAFLISLLQWVSDFF